MFSIYLLMKRKVLLAYIFLLFNIVYAQTDWVRWEGRKISYINDDEYKSTIDKKSMNNFLNLLKKSYKIFISDLDGDNCPFYPSCSQFFIESVYKTNLLKGTLIFIDRFTRDINFFKSSFQYQYRLYGKLYDPVDNYLLIPYKIQINSAN